MSGFLYGKLTVRTTAVKLSDLTRYRFYVSGFPYGKLTVRTKFVGKKARTMETQP